MIDSILGPGNVGRLSGDSHKDRQTLHYLKVVSGNHPSRKLYMTVPLESIEEFHLWILLNQRRAGASLTSHFSALLLSSRPVHTAVMKAKRLRLVKSGSTSYLISTHCSKTGYESSHGKNSFPTLWHDFFASGRAHRFN
mmetsp:Transcript_16566/g.67993  ORF Transcript_16566/g.67993 Transcript_16566/m.67993 type:complete len:139 (-) Transcript_16566:561-977(-)